ncbi:putative sporulation protein YtxC [Halobacillus amylolyticus]|uniref:Sporulation protein YtxC n=1 Tax=Halobacillus amylolyticus TaxID=2932259 RepID=A0ABY4HAP5_9BACI|nr:putative sporulation protein YtxC [Halobacillus amylolyticus]UOR11966.1 putative sporulation protein YtxC [Halobacillus amylolyticus]
MVCIQFSSRKVAFYFHQVITELQIDNSCSWHVKEIAHNKLLIETVLPMRDVYSDFVRSVTRVITDQKLTPWTEGVLKHVFHYKETQEIKRILELSCELRLNPPEGIVFPMMEYEIDQCVKDKLVDRFYVDFDWLSAVCLEEVYDQLLDFTGKVLDEYKLEEAHQLMVDSWRRGINNRDTGVQILHVISDYDLHYYHAEGNEVSREELLVYLKQYPDPFLKKLPIDFGITPALIYAPEELIIYSDQSGDAKLDLLTNLFEEKAVWKPLEEFPFN